VSSKQTRVQFSVLLPCVVEAIVSQDEVRDPGHWTVEYILDADPKVTTTRSVTAHIDQDTWDDIYAKANKQFDLSDTKGS
jgi:hypothetical protein